MRPSWDEYGLALATTASTRAACTRRQVGAVILSMTHRVISMGYNGTQTGEVNCSDGGCPRGQLSYEECAAFSVYTNCRGIHAEHNAIEYAMGRSLAGSTIYITCEPCYECRERIAETFIERVVWPSGEYQNV
ncbi:MAG: cell division protein DedD [Actinobacteria bacterium]|nr:cell division protein DedD [Actinomycetota bacterium]